MAKSGDESISSARAAELPAFTWARMLRVAQKIRRSADNAVRDTPYSAAQLAVLFLVSGNEGVSQQEVAGQLDVTKGNIAKLVSKLERDGLLERRPEGRTNRLILTEKGRRVAQAQMTGHRTFIAGQLSVLSAAELDQLNSLLRKLDRGLK